jgi:3-oxoacyl-[acyl-carrier protein] reductase
MSAERAGLDGPPELPRRRCALVTGGSRGIGRAVAIRLARDGFDVAICYRADEAAAKAAAGLIERAGAAAVAIRADVSDPARVAELAATVSERLGTPHAVVNCAGLRRDGAFALMADEAWSRVLDVNLRGTYHVCRALIRPMIRRHDGVIINVTSVVGIEGNPGQVNYAASKAGIHGLTRSLAKEVGRYGIRVNAVAPGFIDTDMTSGLPGPVRERAREAVALRRFGEPADVAHAVSYLASDQASYVTGAILRVDGGISM